MTIHHLEEIGHWTGNNLLLLITIALTHLCAAIYYKALPLLVVRYVKPTGGNLSQILMFGKVTIALLVGVYGWRCYLTPMVYRLRPGCWWSGCLWMPRSRFGHSSGRSVSDW
jgi:hypothetical protein